MVGVVINGAIVLIEFVQIRNREKLDDPAACPREGARAYSGLTREAFRDCVVESAKLRIIPLSLTTLTTVGGLVPLALFGGPMWVPLATVIIFGLLCGTYMTLLVLPALIVLFVERLHVSFVAAQPR